MDISLESPIAEIKNLSELSDRIDQEPKELFAEEYIIAGPILDNIFRQAAQQANGKSSEPAPIYVARRIQSDESLLKNIFSQAVQQANGKSSQPAPIFVAGTIKPEDTLLVKQLSRQTKNM